MIPPPTVQRLLKLIETARCGAKLLEESLVTAQAEIKRGRPEDLQDAYDELKDVRDDVRIVATQIEDVVQALSTALLKHRSEETQ